MFGLNFIPCVSMLALLYGDPGGATAVGPLTAPSTLSAEGVEDLLVPTFQERCISYSAVRCPGKMGCDRSSGEQCAPGFDESSLIGHVGVGYARADVELHSDILATGLVATSQVHTEGKSDPRIGNWEGIASSVYQ